MSKYSVSLIFSADSGVDIEADSPEEAAELAYNSNEASPSLCHQCARDVNLGDCIRTIVYDENGAEVFDDGWEIKKINRLEQRLSEADKVIKMAKDALGWGEELFAEGGINGWNQFESRKDKALAAIADYEKGK